MKPLRLKMQAFGSYGKETVIDFEKVNQNLFLITGDTGAGKTTIFDAIVFALYGEASSSTNKKDGVVLQSQYVCGTCLCRGTGRDQGSVYRAPRSETSQDDHQRCGEGKTERSYGICESHYAGWD